MAAAVVHGAAGRQHVVGIGELAVTDHPADLIVTHALGSCIAVCIWDPVAQVAGLLHFLLPFAKINPARATAQPAAFADTGMPLLFQGAYTLGLQKKRARVTLVGGADISEINGGALNVGHRNIVGARNILWKNGVLIAGEEVGGSIPRTVALSARDGRLVVRTSGEKVIEL